MYMESLLSKRVPRVSTTMDWEEILLEDHRRSSVKDYYGNGHSDLIRNFYDSIRGKDGTVIPLDEGLKALKIIDTIYQRGI